MTITSNIFTEDIFVHIQNTLFGLFYMLSVTFQLQPHSKTLMTSMLHNVFYGFIKRVQNFLLQFIVTDRSVYKNIKLQNALGTHNYAIDTFLLNSCVHKK